MVRGRVQGVVWSRDVSSGSFPGSVTLVGMWCSMGRDPYVCVISGTAIMVLPVVYPPFGGV